jgi:uncharacterized protein (DUF2141 family)
MNPPLPLLHALVCVGVVLLGGDTPALADERKAGATLEVSIKRLRNDTGRVAVALFKDPDAFPDQKRALRGRVVAISRKQARTRFEGLAPGRYALAVLHDENNNDEMDFNLLGMPLEGYGFSNDAHAMFGPPSFEEARFSVAKSGTRHTVNVRYFSL